jgi:penicillin-binding protein-related factor A (putative recombinase)
MKNIDLATIKSFILANALSENVMLMLHPSNFNKLVKSGKKKVKALCISGINVIPDENNEISEGEIDILEVRFN